MNVGIWIRVSTEDQAKGESPKHHESRARSYAEFKGWNVVEKYDLSGMTGKSVMDYPDTKRMLADVASGKIKGLIFSKLARLARNTKELLDFADYFKKHGADLISLSESIDTSSPAGRLFYTMIAALAEWEREEIASRIRASVPVRAKMNKLLGNKPPFGYTVKDKKVVVNDEEAPFVRAVFSIFAECKSYNGTAKRVGKLGHVGQMMVRRIIHDPIYKGMRIANRFEGHKPKPQDQWVIVKVEPIVTEELWEKCQQIAKKITRKWPSAGKHPFAGLVWCKCGSKLYKDKKIGGSYRCRKCNFKIEEAMLMQQYRLALRKIVVEPELLKSTEDFSSLLKETELSQAEIQKTLAAIEKQIDTLIELYREKLLSEADFKKRFEPLSTDRETLNDELAAIEGKIDYYKNGALNQEYLIDTAKSLDELWDKLSEDGRIDIIKELTDSIRVSENEIKITLFYFGKLLPDSRKHSPDHIHPLSFAPVRYEIALRGLFDSKFKDYPLNPVTIGEHVKKKRKDLGLTQARVAEIIGVDPSSIVRWENNQDIPKEVYFPKVIDFLGYIPFNPSDDSLISKLDYVRKIRGLTMSALAKTLKRNDDLVWQWLTGKKKPRKRANIAAIEAFINKTNYQDY